MNVISTGVIKEYLIQEARRLEESIQQYQERLTWVSPSDGDEGDHAINLLEQSHTRTVLEQLQQQLSRVEAARERLAEGKYGVCEGCGQAIPPERLEAIPYATLCVRCQAQREQRRGARPMAPSRSLRAV